MQPEVETKINTRRVAMIQWDCHDSRPLRNTHFTVTVKLLQHITERSKVATRFT